jgi:hypothetical protein
MLLHWIFVLSGLIQIQKKIQNLLENDFEKNLERKRKENSLYSLSLSFLAYLALFSRAAQQVAYSNSAAAGPPSPAGYWRSPAPFLLSAAQLHHAAHLRFPPLRTVGRAQHRASASALRLPGPT